MEQKNTWNKKMEETSPSFEEWRRTWAVLPVSFKQLKLLMVSSNRSSVELDEYPNSFSLNITVSVNSLYDFQVAKESIFLLFCLLHHMEKKETKLDTS